MARLAWLRVATAAAVMAAHVACTHDFDALLPEGTAGDAASTDGATADSGPACTESGARRFGGHCYFASSSAGWDEARSACEARGAHLVTIGSREEQDAVESIRDGRDRWIGLSRPKGSPSAEASFAWVTGEPSTYERWSGDEPNGSGECARLRGDGRWADADCGASYVAICERE